MEKKYDILMIDPPWDKQKGGLRKARPNQTRELDYSTMPIGEIFRLLDNEVFPKAKETHAVFMWCIDKYLCEIDKWMFERGYKKHCIFIWNTVRYSHEYLIWYYKPKMIKINKSMRGITVFKEKSGRHSEKPLFAYTMINALYPNSSRIDVFARRKLYGWDRLTLRTQRQNGKRKL